ncbi:MAG: deoxyribonuclease IV [Blastocatellia bacterium]|jgi:deoxyribonuclease-4
MNQPSRPLQTRPQARARIGLHTGIGGGLDRSIQRAAEKGCQTWQIFSRNPRGWTARPLDAAEVARFREERDAAQLDPCVVHSCYLINLAATAEETRAKSITAFRDELERCLLIGADYLVVHPGSARGASPEAAITTCASALHAAARGLEDQLHAAPLTILLENTAGQGEQIGRTFEQMRDLLALCPSLPMGMCLDTAHSFAAGYDWRDAEAAEQALARLDETVGFSRVHVVHFNDSRAAFRSFVDRHWHLGEGEIGLDGLARVIGHPSLSHLPFILETPQDNPGDDLRNLEAARALSLRQG